MENIVNSYKWTTTTGSYLDEAPRVYATAYEVSGNAILKTIQSYYQLAETAVTGSGNSVGGVEYYDKLHKTKKNPENFIFPYFNDEVRNFNNAWGDSYVGSTNGSDTGISYLSELKGLSDQVINLTSQFNALRTNSPGALLEPPKFYQYSQDEGGITVSFILINTDSADDAIKNYNLVKKLINDNRFERDNSNAFLVNPPKLWSLIIPGYRAIRWASCGVAVNLLGSRRYINKKLIPEGYNITLNFTPLYTEPSNFSSYYDASGF
jgi:hypothetical protein